MFAALSSSTAASAAVTLLQGVGEAASTPGDTFAALVGETTAPSDLVQHRQAASAIVTAPAAMGNTEAGVDPQGIPSPLVIPSTATVWSASLPGAPQESQTSPAGTSESPPLIATAVSGSVASTTDDGSSASMQGAPGSLVAAPADAGITRAAPAPEATTPTPPLPSALTAGTLTGGGVATPSPPSAPGLKPAALTAGARPPMAQAPAAAIAPAPAASPSTRPAGEAATLGGDAPASIGQADDPKGSGENERGAAAGPADATAYPAVMMASPAMINAIATTSSTAGSNRIGSVIDNGPARPGAAGPLAELPLTKDGSAIVAAPQNVAFGGLTGSTAAAENLPATPAQAAGAPAAPTALATPRGQSSSLDGSDSAPLQSARRERDCASRRLGRLQNLRLAGCDQRRFARICAACLWAPCIWAPCIWAPCIWAPCIWAASVQAGGARRLGLRRGGDSRGRSPPALSIVERRAGEPSPCGRFGDCSRGRFGVGASGQRSKPGAGAP